MKAKTPKSKVTKVSADDQFVITIKIENAVYEGTGATALEALQSVPAPSNDLISSGNVRITHGDKFKDMFFAGPQLKRLLNPYNMEVLANDLTSGL